MERDFRHCTKIQLRFADMDLLGHVNNAVFMSYFETARMSYFKDVIADSLERLKIGLIIAKTTIEYKVPVMLGDETYAYTKIIRFGNKSFDISNYLVKKKGNEELVCCEATSTIVCVNTVTTETIAVPEEWKNRVNAFQ
ncbi:MAG: acyl-CoA thioesterase [Bacteroidia bacterium]